MAVSPPGTAVPPVSIRAARLHGRRYSEAAPWGVDLIVSIRAARLHGRRSWTMQRYARVNPVSIRAARLHGRRFIGCWDGRMADWFQSAPPVCTGGDHRHQPEPIQEHCFNPRRPFARAAISTAALTRRRTPGFNPRRPFARAAICTAALTVS